MIANLISKLFNSLNEEKINYAILRNYDSMPNKPKDTEYFDLDMLVVNKDLKKFNEIINQVIKNEEASLIKTFERSYVHTFRIVKSNNKIFENVQIDVHTKGQGWWGFYYLLENEILKDRTKYKEFYVVSDFHCHLFSWLDKLLWGKTVKPKYSKPIKQSMQINIDKLDHFLNKIIYSKKVIFNIKNIFLNQDENTEATIAYRKIILRNIIFWSILNHPFKTCYWTIEFFVRELMLRLFPSGLFVIIKHENPFCKNFYLTLKNTAIMGQISLFVNLNQKNKLQFFYEYFKTIWPIVRIQGLAVCIFDKNYFVNKLIPNSKILEDEEANHSLVAQILSEYKKGNMIGFPNVTINNK